MLKPLLTLSIALIATSACAAGNVCNIDKAEDAAKCPAGSTILLNTNFWTARNNPAKFADKYCDKSKEIRWEGCNFVCVKKKDSDAEKENKK